MIAKYSQLLKATKEELLEFIDNADRTGYHLVPDDAVQELNNRSSQDLADKTLKVAKIAMWVSLVTAFISLVACVVTILQALGLTLK